MSARLLIALTLVFALALLAAYGLGLRTAPGVDFALWALVAAFFGALLIAVARDRPGGPPRAGDGGEGGRDPRAG